MPASRRVRKPPHAACCSVTTCLVLLVSFSGLPLPALLLPRERSGRVAVHQRQAHCPELDRDRWCIRRRLSLPALCTAVGLPAFAEDNDGVAVRLLRELNGKAPLINPGVSWNLGRYLSGKPGVQLVYPIWLEGTWNVSTKFLGATAPEGNKYIRKTTPGVQQGSLLALPNVGEEPKFLQRFVAAPAGVGGPGGTDAPGVVEDRAFSMRSRFEAFLPRAHVQFVLYNATEEPTRVSLQYTTPSRSSFAPTTRARELFINNREGAFSTSDSFICVETFRQSNLELSTSGDYKVIMAFRRNSSNADEVLVKLRAGAFLTPLDEAYFELGDKAVAVYDYSLRMTRTADA